MAGASAVSVSAPSAAAVVSASAAVVAAAAVVSAVLDPPQAASDTVITPAMATLANFFNFIILSSMKCSLQNPIKIRQVLAAPLHLTFHRCPTH